MKKNYVLLLCTALVMLALYGCSEKFKTAAPFKNVTVVVGLLNVRDTAHYIKISRGFFDEDKNNIELAKISDSLYYSNLDVKLDVKNASGSVLKTIDLNKVKLSDEGITKDTGVFANNPAYAYKFKEVLNTGNKYDLRITLPNGKVVTGSTKVLGDITLSNFNVISFANFEGTYEFNWIAPENAGICEFYYRFSYVEENVNTNTSEDLYVDIPLALNQEVSLTNSAGRYLFKNKEFYYALSAYVPVKGLQYRRYVDTGQIIAYAGSRELQNYINQNNAQGGLTADQIKPVFSNLSGEDTYGIYSSRLRQVKFNVPLTINTIDSLRVNKVVAALQIVGPSLK